LADVGSKFATVGLSQQASKAYIKADNVKEAINVCVRLNQWDLAVKLANEHKVTEARWPKEGHCLTCRKGQTQGGMLDTGLGWADRGAADQVRNLPSPQQQGHRSNRGTSSATAGGGRGVHFICLVAV
jgi:hypothetical protein